MELTLYAGYGEEAVRATLRAAERLRREFGVRVYFQVSTDLFGFSEPAIEIEGSLVPLFGSQRDMEEKIISEVLKAVFGGKRSGEALRPRAVVGSPSTAEGAYAF